MRRCMDVLTGEPAYNYHVVSAVSVKPAASEAHIEHLDWVQTLACVKQSMTRDFVGRHSALQAR